MKTCITAFFTLLFTCLLGIGCTAQEASHLTDFDPRAFLTPIGQRPQVLLLGTFHFSYPNLDSHVTEEADQVDFENAQRKAELEELIDYIARFKPTKIIVEQRNGSRINELYRDYLRDGFDEPRTGEIFQLAFPLGKRFGIDTLVLGDATSIAHEMDTRADSLTYRILLNEVFDDTPTRADTMTYQRYWELYRTEDKREAGSSLLDIFRYMNEPDRIRLGHGHYVQFVNDRSADALAINWYSRNLRIYNRISKAITSPNDRVLVLFGAGHLGILTQQLESDVRYEQVRFGDL